MMPAFLWYTLVDNPSLEQGDFFFNCPVLEPVMPLPGAAAGEGAISAEAREYDVVVLSQSCDLAQNKIETVLVCPHWPLEAVEKAPGFLPLKNGKEEVRRGNVPSLHMLAACNVPGFSSPIRIVSFRQVFGLPFAYVQSLAKKPGPRLRLLPPYREHLAQAFARFVMRVGLPADIPAFK